MASTSAAEIPPQPAAAVPPPQQAPQRSPQRTSERTYEEDRITLKTQLECKHDVKYHWIIPISFYNEKIAENVNTLTMTTTIVVGNFKRLLLHLNISDPNDLTINVEVMNLRNVNPMRIRFGIEGLTNIEDELQMVCNFSQTNHRSCTFSLVKKSTFDKFIKETKLKDIKITCHFYYFAVQYLDMHYQFNDRHADFDLYIAGDAKPLRVHKTVLVRNSGFFKDKFQAEYAKLCLSEEMSINEHHNLFIKMLRNWYGEEIIDFPLVADKFLILATRYKSENLIKRCEYSITTELAGGERLPDLTIPKYLVTAHLTNSEVVEQAVCNYIVRNEARAKQIFASTDWQKMTLDYPSAFEALENKPIMQYFIERAQFLNETVRYTPFLVAPEIAAINDIRKIRFFRDNAQKIPQTCICLETRTHSLCYDCENADWRNEDLPENRPADEMSES